MRQLLIVLATATAVSSTGCVNGIGSAVRHVEGNLVDAVGKPIDAWVGVSDEQADPDRRYSDFSLRQEIGKPEENWCGLTHTRQNGHFNLDASGAMWDFTLLLGFIPLGNPCPPQVPVVDHIFIHTRDDEGWRSTCVSLTAEQQKRHKPGERWVDLGTVVIP